MPEDSGVPPTDQPAPEMDTPAPESDTAQNTPPAPTDNLDSRYKALQAEFTRKSQAAAKAEAKAAELEARLAQQATTGTPETPETAQRTSELTRLREQLAESEWARANGVYGPEVATAYEAFQQQLASDQTPLGWLTALESYHETRSHKAPPVTRAQALAPRVDSNRSDVGPDQATRKPEARTGDAAMVSGIQGLLAKAPWAHN